MKNIPLDLNANKPIQKTT